MNSILSVTTAAESFDLTVLATVKDELGIKPQDNVHDRKLGAHIRTASDIVSRYCNRVFASETLTETFWAPGCVSQDCMVLSRDPVSSITSVTLDGEVIDASEYRLHDAGLLYRLDEQGYPSTWSFSKSLVVVYVAGYALLDGLPYGIERATILLVKEFWGSGGRDPRIKSENIPGVIATEYWVGPTSSSAELPPDVVALLKPHVRTRFV